LSASTDPLEALSDEARRSLRRARADWMQPMLATLTEARFSDPGWIFETKLDGIRGIAVRRGRDVRLFSRTRQDLSGQFPEVAEAMQRQNTPDFVIDGEVVAFEANRTSFARLQQRHRKRVATFYYVFDVMHVGGYDLTELELRDRKRVLRRLLTFEGPLRQSSHRNEDGERVYREACRKGLEGVIAKRADSVYVHGRSPNWLKFKCVNEQEFVIGGFTDPKGSRKGFGALLIGYYEDGTLRYGGKVGTGFDDEMLERLSKTLRATERKAPPFAAGRVPRKDAHWVEPELVAEIGFTEWTADGLLRHPRFLGLRTDKRPKEVVREHPS
jgi:bifunctional non-homologous end joining protein LigD